MMVDETTDISVKKSLFVIGKFWSDNGVYDRLLYLVNVSDGTYEALYKQIKKLLDDNKIPYENLIGFAADNAHTIYDGLSQWIRSKVETT